MKFQIIENSRAYCWHLLADDGRILARSREYSNLKACKKDVHYVVLSAVSISLDHLLSPDTFSLASNQLAAPADFLSAATPAALPDDIFDNL